MATISRCGNRQTARCATKAIVEIRTAKDHVIRRSQTLGYRSAETLGEALFSTAPAPGRVYVVDFRMESNGSGGPDLRRQEINDLPVFSNHLILERMASAGDEEAMKRKSRFTEAQTVKICSSGQRGSGVRKSAKKHGSPLRRIESHSSAAAS